ncbi:MAG: FIG00466559: hypothetical protein [uncultured Paraburkholderia sp.]|nr:MAG: FIG00466559: hypothetical protein [uncultured Paraburkholderia sp.]
MCKSYCDINIQRQADRAAGASWPYLITWRDAVHKKRSHHADHFSIHCITGRCDASGPLLGLIGKRLSERGVIMHDELPAAIDRLETAITGRHQRGSRA